MSAGTSQWYSDTAHVHAVTHVGGTRKFWYDANGNEITRTVGAVTYVQTWDAENRLASVTQGGNTTSFTYNGDGARVRVSVNGVITTYVGTTYETVTTTGVTTYYYLGSQRVAMRTSAGVTWLAADHLGSTSLSMNSGGARVAEERYYPYGATRVVTNTMATDYQFTGQKNDTSTGLYYYNARYYDPVVGRFISPDPVPPAAASSQSRNRYAYVYNNPLRYVDPSGLMACGGYDDVDCDVNQDLKNQWYNAHGVYQGPDGQWTEQGPATFGNAAVFAGSVAREAGLILSSEWGTWSTESKANLAAGVVAFGQAVSGGIQRLAALTRGPATVNVGDILPICALLGGSSCALGAPLSDNHTVYLGGGFTPENVVHELAHVIDWNNSVASGFLVNPTVSYSWGGAPLTEYAQNSLASQLGFPWENWAEAVTVLAFPGYRSEERVSLRQRIDPEAVGRQRSSMRSLLDRMP